jgi:hypothetical protein
MPDKIKVKVIFHFIKENRFLKGFYKIVETEKGYPFDAFKEFSKYDNYVTKWKNKWVCINCKNIAYLECKELKTDAR